MKIFSQMTLAILLTTVVNGAVHADGGGIEHATATGHTEAAACSMALSNAEGRVQMMRPFKTVTKKKCDCKENPNARSDLERWNCVAMVTYQQR